MNYTKTNPVGLDAVIHDIQTKLMGLETTWGVTLDGYPRCYTKLINGIKTIEPFLKGKDYKNILYREKNKFWFTNDREETALNRNYFKTTISLYFTVNLKQIKPDIEHRADNEVRMDVIDVLRTIPNIAVNTIVTGIENVYRGLNYNETDDMQPYHCFRIDIDVLEYSLNQKTCN